MRTAGQFFALALATASILIAACGGGDAPVALERPATIISGESTAARVDTNSDDLLVYSVPGSEDPARDGHPTAHVHVYDLTNRVEMADIAIDQSVTVQFSATRGEVLFVGSYGSRLELHAVAVDTGDDRLVYRLPPDTGSDGAATGAFALSPDGLSVMLAQPGETAGVDEVVSADLASGEQRVIASIPRTPSHGNRGPLTVRGWRDDGRGVLLSGLDTKGDSGRWATLMLDGMLHEHALLHSARLLRNGRLFIDDGVNMAWVHPAWRRGPTRPRSRSRHRCSGCRGRQSGPRLRRARVVSGTALRFCSHTIRHCPPRPANVCRHTTWRRRRTCSSRRVGGHNRSRMSTLCVATGMAATTSNSSARLTVDLVGRGV